MRSRRRRPHRVSRLARPSHQADSRRRRRPVPVRCGSGAPGHVFVLGDNLEASVDSRHFGFVPVERVVGRVIRRLAL
ncbi:hypothetical protein FLX08_06065 [Microbispora hainanensis]|uniref:Peptidase S26 domain-containing protein n=1 Tax=Microbispora hainanensis TaxID=568844 RepID=A0A544Z1V6_9ACTN|nr:hypothetical protein FLX08_06065 [Microbispora hainanensis]